MISKRDKVALGLAIVFGILAAILITTYVQRQQPRMIRVMVAKEDIPAGATFSDELLTARSVPKEGINEREVVTAAEFLARGAAFQSQKALVYVPKDVLILRSFFSFEERTLAKIVPVGMRAVTVRVDEVSGVGYALEAGDHVDVIVAYPARRLMAAERERSQPEVRSEVLLEDITILRTNDERHMTIAYEGGEAPSRRYSSVTLATTLDQAARFVEAEQLGGRVALVLRNPAEAPVAPEEADIPAAPAPK